MSLSGKPRWLFSLKPLNLQKLSKKLPAVFVKIFNRLQSRGLQLDFIIAIKAIRHGQLIAPHQNMQAGWRNKIIITNLINLLCTPEGRL